MLNPRKIPVYIWIILITRSIFSRSLNSYSRRFPLRFSVSLKDMPNNMIDGGPSPSSSGSMKVKKSSKLIDVGYATDVEGNFDYWSRYVEISKVLSRSLSGSLELRESCHFVYGGDAVDRGTGDLRVLTDLVSLKRAYPDRVHFIMGNRDINKMRMPVELHPMSLKITPKCYWVKPEADDQDYWTKPATLAERVKWVSHSLFFYSESSSFIFLRFRSSIFLIIV
jgi:hypothetical protein